MHKKAPNKEWVLIIIINRANSRSKVSEIMRFNIANLIKTTCSKIKANMYKISSNKVVN